LSFDGVDDYVSATDPVLGTSDFTLEAWIYPQANDKYILSTRTNEGNGPGNWWNMGISSTNNLFFEMGEAGTGSYFYDNGSLPVAMNQWSHVAVVRKGRHIRLYVNGELDKDTLDVTVRDLTTGMGELHIGGWPQFNLSWFQGSIDEVRIRNVAYTISQIRANRVAYVNGQFDLLAYYTFDQGTPGANNTVNNQLVDLSGNNNTGSLNGFQLQGSGSNWSGGYAGGVYADNDGDGFGDPNSSVTTTTPCFMGSNYVSDNSDCDDNNPSITNCNIPDADLVVEENGLNGAYTNITAALAAAASGDRIIVYPRSGGQAYNESISPTDPSLTNVMITSATSPEKFTINGGLTLGTGWDVSYIQINGGVTSASQTNDDIALTNAIVYGSVDLSGAPGYAFVWNDSILNSSNGNALQIARGEINGCYITSDGNGINLVNGFYPDEMITITDNQIYITGNGTVVHIENSQNPLYFTNNLLSMLSTAGGQGPDGITSYGAYYSGTQSTFINNTIVAASTCNLAAYFHGGPNWLIKNNLIYVNGGNTGYGVEDGQPAEFSYNYYRDATGPGNPFSGTLVADNTNVGASNTRVGFDGAVFPGTDPINGGDPNPIYNDASDGSRNDAGCFGGDGSLINAFHYSYPYCLQSVTSPASGSTIDPVGTPVMTVSFVPEPTASYYHIFGTNIPSTGYILDTMVIGTPFTIPTPPIGHYSFSIYPQNALGSASECTGEEVTAFTVDTPCVQVRYYFDNDGDGYGDVNNFQVAGCLAPLAYVSDSTDCDDNDYYVHVNCSGCNVTLTDLTWKSYNVFPGAGWEQPGFDDSGWNSPIDLGQANSLFGITPRPEKIWDPNITNIAYFRRTFTLNGADHMILDFDADDDAIVYINGVQVNNDFDCNISVVKGIDITSYLDLNGDNTMAVQVQNCQGDYYFTAQLYNGYFVDGDHDGYGSQSAVQFCAPPGPGLVRNNLDCDDENPLVQPLTPYVSIVGSPELPGCTSFNDTLRVGQVYDYRYVDHVIAFSSEYTPTDYGSAQIIGPPSIYPTYGDNATAWAPLTQDDSREFIEVGFATAAPINFVDIYETYATGSIDTVYVLNPNTSAYEAVYTTTAGSRSETSRKLHISFPTTSFPVSAIRIAMNSPFVHDWNELDAVAVGRFENATFDSYNWSTADFTSFITTNIPGTFSVTVTSGACTGTSDEIAITTKSVNAGPASNWIICPGSSTVLAAGGASS
ncbi:MAG TPA: LamG domain-containing protein, partial [Bacteroidia bacterium]|nr:LamG domain-containing protein [Bacteroidia bacterium]